MEVLAGIVIVVFAVFLIMAPLVGSIRPQVETSLREERRKEKHKHQGAFIDHPYAVPIPGGGATIHHYQVCQVCGERFGPLGTDVYPPLS